MTSTTGVVLGLDPGPRSVTGLRDTDYRHQVTGVTLWTRRDVAVVFGRCAGTVQNWAMGADSPAPVGCSGVALVYNPDHIRSWWADRTLAEDDRWSLPSASVGLGNLLSALKSEHRRGRLPHHGGHIDGRAWWRPDTLRDWATVPRIPDGAWKLADVRTEVGHTRRLPPSEGQPSSGRSW